MNLVHLRPGQGTFQPTGTLHAYLEGATVELMANSDNVLRGGLTSKHVDVTELLRILSFEGTAPRILEGRTVSPVETRYATRAEEFLLRRLSVAPGQPYATGAQHSADGLIVMDGGVLLRSAGRGLKLGRGGTALVPAGIPYSVESEAGPATLFAAGVPQVDIIPEGDDG